MKKIIIILLIIIVETWLIYEAVYQDRIYPGVIVAGEKLANWRKEEVENFFNLKNQDFHQTRFVFSFENKTATVSGTTLNWGYDSAKIAQEAYQIARTGSFWQNLITKVNIFYKGITLSLSYRFDKRKLNAVLATFNQEFYQPAQNALFQFKDGRVVGFQREQEGREINTEQAIRAIEEKLGQPDQLIIIELTSRPIKPEISIDEVNNLGIKELLAEGFSYFWGSSSSRIHNIVLAASQLNGLLIKPNEVFSFNQALGEVSPATGYQQAFIIKEGKTILGDGGGVCQVSTTLFRAALNSGLPIIERVPHSYRVSFYEQGGFGPGLDATVFSPTADLKFKNNTPAHILIQALADTQSKTLTFSLYGTSDGRKASLSPPKIWEQTPPPEDLYQDEPSLPQGVIKQIERSIPGAKVSFDWQVTQGEEIIDQKTFYSVYQSWQAIYLRGTGK